MTRNLKVLGLALVAAFALSAMTASAASAAPALFTANSHVGNAKIHGGQIGTDTFTIGALSPLTCATATVSGEGVTAGTSSTYVKLAPTYDTCHIVAPLVGTRTATVNVEGCTYTVNATKNTTSAPSPGPTPGVATPFSADLQITCPENQSIKIHIYNTANHNHSPAAVLCTFDVGPQTINNQIQLTNTVTHDVEAHIHANVALTSTITGGICGATVNPTSIYKGVDTLTATNSEGASVGSTVS